MYKLKNSLIALAGMLILIGVLSAVARETSQGQGNRPSSDVKVVNTPNVSVVNTPAVNAQQHGAWNVGISGTPTVALEQGLNRRPENSYFHAGHRADAGSVAVG